MVSNLKSPYESVGVVVGVVLVVEVERGTEIRIVLFTPSKKDVQR